MNWNHKLECLSPQKIWYLDDEDYQDYQVSIFEMPDCFKFENEDYSYDVAYKGSTIGSGYAPNVKKAQELSEEIIKDHFNN